jgi:hypothetical protein
LSTGSTGFTPPLYQFTRAPRCNPKPRAEATRAEPVEASDAPD